MMFYFFWDVLIWPLVYFGFWVGARFSKKIARGLELRLPVGGKAPWVKLLPPTTPTVWFHAASGEFEYAKPVITRLKIVRPDARIVVTYFSPTYADHARKFSGVDWVVPLPWDTPRALAEFLGSYRPSCLLVARTDVWPQMARQTRLRHIASVLFSATLTEDSSRTRGLGRWATRTTLDQLDDIFCVSEADVTAFRSLGLTRARVSREGDTRFDQVLARLASPKPVKDLRLRSHSQNSVGVSTTSGSLLVCGSTWPEDEAVLIPAIARSGVRAVIVPHEPTPEHLESLEKQLRAAGLEPVRYSADDSEARFAVAGSCLIVDQVGLLAELYLQARWAFVGGSFRKTVHSVMEPLAAGCRTFVGPKHTNNREAVEFAGLRTREGLGYVTCVANADDLARELSRELAQPDDTAREQIRAAVEARTGSSQKLVDWILAKI